MRQKMKRSGRNMKKSTGIRRKNGERKKGNRKDAKRKSRQM